MEEQQTSFMASCSLFQEFVLSRIGVVERSMEDLRSDIIALRRLVVASRPTAPSVDASTGSSSVDEARTK